MSDFNQLLYRLNQIAEQQERIAKAVERLVELAEAETRSEMKAAEASRRY